MYPLTHFLLAFLIGLILVYYGQFNLFQAFITGLVALLIDIDHFIYYSIRKKDFSFKNAWNAAVKHKLNERTLIHHLPGFLISSLILLILFFLNKTWFLILFIGYYSHIFLDYLDIKRWLEVKRKIKFKEEGFYFKIPIYEIILIMAMIILIILLIF